MIRIRPAEQTDATAIWRVLEPTIRAGETYALDPMLSAADAIAYWLSVAHQVFVAELDGEVAGTYCLRANQAGRGAHVANCGYVSHPSQFGRGVARAMCAHSIEQARILGFRAMQFNFVISTNERALRLWKSFEFEIVGRLPEAYLHPRLGYVDALVLFRKL